MKIAIIGSGISGLSAAYYLNKDHDITLFEKRDRLGGHTATKSISWQGERFNIDTGFIVFNDWTYPNFIHLINTLEVPSKATSMGFSVTDKDRKFEYAGENLSTLFTQKRNLFSLSYLKMLLEIVKFNKQSKRDFDAGKISATLTLGEYLEKEGYSMRFCHDYLVPMASAIWSATFTQVRKFQMQFFVRFFHNHGLLSVKNRPQWRVIEGGSHSYIEPLVSGFKERIRLNMDIKSVTRSPEGVEIKFENGDLQGFDQVVFACHSDEALTLLTDASENENEILGSLPYSMNDVCLHTDTSLLPSRKKAWSAWNYLLRSSDPTASTGADESKPVLTYDMNILQSIESSHTFCVTLNANDKVDPSKVIGRYQYAHPQFSVEGMQAQQRWAEINGSNNTYFCGAYWANGFHEDGVVSALKVCKSINESAGLEALEILEERVAVRDDIS